MGKKNRKHNTNIIYKSILFKISTKRRFPQKFSSVCNINKLGLFGFDNMVHFWTKSTECSALGNTLMVLQLKHHT